MPPPAKRAKLLLDDGQSDDETSRTQTENTTLKINSEFARRFEHNKEREEHQRLEEQYNSDEDGSSSDETEDDEAELVTADLDEEIATTLKAIKSKDPRVYDKSVKFYQEYDEADSNTAGQSTKKEKDKPMTLRDYHRENLMAGYTGEDVDEDDNKPQTYTQEQDSLRRDITKQMHAMADEDEEDEDEDDGFTVKAKGAHEDVPIARKRKVTDVDVAAADQDPETFLSNFMASQAWRSAGEAHPQAFDSDDSADEKRAEAFEEAYNLRFEDPSKSNETLKSFARDSGQYSVRREQTGARKKAREREKEAQEAARRERDDNKARLRKLKIGEVERKLQAIKKAAGLSGAEADLEQWKKMLEGDFDDKDWDKVMEKRFGADYYAQRDDDLSGEKKSKKPKWDDDIEINDLVPTFTAEDDGNNFDLSDEDGDDAVEPVTGDVDAGADATTASSKKRTTKKDREQAKRDAKSQSRRERRAIEELVDASLPVAAAQASGFRYRETSPTSFGLSTQDILFATDAQLNEFVGLKKLATFRDEGRKTKDREKLSKKGRLREWRKDCFGNAKGVVMDDSQDAAPVDAEKSQSQSSKKRKRKNKSKKVSID